MNGRNLKIYLAVAVVLTAAMPPVLGRSGVSLAVRTARAQSKVKNPHGDYKEDCSLCHRATGWKPAQISKKFDHEKFGIPLQGAHATVACTQCHTSLDFAMAPTACVDCHADVHNAELGSDCARCHGTRSFIDRNDQIRMHRLTRFPLAGAHQTLDCEMCHRLAAPGSLSWVNTAADCASCHMADYNATSDPDHAGAGFSQDCAACHNEQAWSRVRFDHGETAFPLTGVHSSLACESCHVGGVFSGLSTACVSCHQQDYDGATNPDHAGAGFPTTCESCHGTRGWSGADFNHATTGFPLTGAHLGRACAECHIGNVFTGLSAACVSCHQQDYDGTTNPNHASSGMPTTCESCHSTRDWSGASFNHATTSFPLTGAHIATPCADCHVGNVYTGLPSACVSCHQTDYDGTADPNHAAAGFSTDCTICHTTTRWDGATFDHNQWFPIYSGKHAGEWQTCNDCHTNAASYAAFSCFGCHPHSDKAKTDDDHRGENGYSYDSNACYDCHPDGRS